MIDAFYVAQTGLNAGQKQIDTISNNLANLNTVAFKRSRVEFGDLVSQQPVDQLRGATLKPEQLGLGTSIDSVARQFSEGDLKLTNNPLDLAVKGPGFFEVTLENGDLAYTRGGNFMVDKDGYLATASGHRLADSIQIPPDASKVVIGTDGTVQVSVAGQSTPLDVGQIQMVNFNNPDALNALGDNLFAATDESGTPYYSNAGENGLGTIQQGFLEQSNVDLVNELVDLVVAQRSYQANSHVIQAADEIMQTNNKLRG